MGGCNGAQSVAERSYPMSEVRGQKPGGATPHPRGVAAWAPEGLEELFHIQGQEGQQ